MNPAMPTLACIRCAERKVRCDRQTPCNSCVRHDVECVYRPPKKPGRRKRNSGIDEQILERLRHYETLLLENGIQVSTSHPNAHSAGSDMTYSTVMRMPQNPPRGNICADRSLVTGGLSSTADLIKFWGRPRPGSRPAIANTGIK